jgi:hypothetical protein
MLRFLLQKEENLRSSAGQGPSRTAAVGEFRTSQKRSKSISEEAAPEASSSSSIGRPVSRGGSASGRPSSSRKHHTLPSRPSPPFHHQPVSSPSSLVFVPSQSPYQARQHHAHMELSRPPSASSSSSSAYHLSIPEQFYPPPPHPPSLQPALGSPLPYPQQAPAGYGYAHLPTQQPHSGPPPSSASGSNIVYGPPQQPPPDAVYTQYLTPTPSGSSTQSGGGGGGGGGHEWAEFTSDPSGEGGLASSILPPGMMPTNVELGYIFRQAGLSPTGSTASSSPTQQRPPRQQHQQQQPGQQQQQQGQHPELDIYTAAAAAAAVQQQQQQHHHHHHHRPSGM